MRQLVRSTGKRLVYSGLTRVAGDENHEVLLPVVRGPARGLRFRLDLVERKESAYFLGKYDDAILRRLSRLCRPGWTVWDCGTYLGLYTVFFARLVGSSGNVVAVEPDPWNLARTRRHAAMNGLHNIQFVEAAVGAPTGTTTFIFSRNTNSHIAGAYVGGSYGEYADKERVDARSEVRCLSLDQLYTEENLPSPNLIKLDIEGAEKDALSHAEKLCSEVKPLIVLELHNPDCDEAAWNFARSTGYTLERMTDGMPIQSREATEGTLLCVPTE